MATIDVALTREDLRHIEAGLIRHHRVVMSKGNPIPQSVRVTSGRSIAYTLRKVREAAKELDAAERLAREQGA